MIFNAYNCSYFISVNTLKYFPNKSSFHALFFKDYVIQFSCSFEILRIFKTQLSYLDLHCKKYNSFEKKLQIHNLQNSHFEFIRELDTSLNNEEKQ